MFFSNTCMYAPTDILIIFDNICYSCMPICSWAIMAYCVINYHTNAHTKEITSYYTIYWLAKKKIKKKENDYDNNNNKIKNITA